MAEVRQKSGTNILGRALSAFLALAILGAIAALVYSVAAAPKEKFTEFYILDAGGKATNYPTQLRVGEEAALILGIVNLEQTTMSYKVEIEIDGATVSKLGPIVLEHGSKYEHIVTFTPDKPGDEQKVEFLLFREGQSEVYRSLYFWIDVKE